VRRKISNSLASELDPNVFVNRKVIHLMAEN
jgi:hypothetical protein